MDHLSTTQRDPLARLDGAAREIVALREQIRRLAAFDTVGAAMVPTLLLQGETGTGKGLVARIVHDAGPRARGPFVPVNCAAIPETMLEAELFGHEPGAFTDARRAKPGLFEAAAGGTLFLDEIDSLGLPLQSKLLTAIEEKRVRRLGAVREQAVDVKLVAATQQDLAALAAAGGFRPDLYHRLAVLVLALPPLRARGEDVVALARGLLERFAAGYGARPKQLAADAEAWLRRQPWPGNVRELSHLMERVTLLHPEAAVDADGLARLAAPSGGTAADTPETAARPAAGPADEEPEAARLREALARTGGNVVRAARLLGVSRDTMRYRMRRHAIHRPDLDRAPADPAPSAPPPAPARAGDAAARPSPAAPAEARAPAWEQKPVAVVAVGLSWPTAESDGTPGHEPWTEQQRWEHRIREKLSGLGAAPVQEGPGLSVWAFGVPRALDQLVERAVHGALAVRHIATAVPAGDAVPALRVAVHHGAMLMDGAAEAPVAGALPVGETVALPLRLLGEAEPGEIVVSQEIERRVAAWTRTEGFAPRSRAVAGRRPEIFRVHGLRPWQERAGGRRRLTPFVGRERELATLRDLVEAAAAGAGQIVGIVGAPGTGKSRLLRELRRHLESRGVIYAEAHGLAHASLTPLLPVAELIRDYLEVTDADPLEAVRDKVRARLDGLGLDPEADAPYVLGLIGAAAPPRADGETVKRRTFELFRRIVLAFSRERPLVLALENAHWLDATTDACVVALAEHLAGARCLVVVTYRPGYRPGWLDKSYATQIALAPLGLEESRRIVAAVAGERALPRPVTDQVLARAEGNPLFLEELARAVLDDDGATSGTTIPDTVHAVIAARIDRLSPEDRHLLRAAAVVGRDVPVDVLERVAGVEPEPLRAGLGRLQAAEFLFERRGRAEPTVGFKHALTQAAAYQGLSGSSRQRLHLRVLEVLEAAAGERRAEMLEALAHHAAAGADWAKAVTCFREAGLRALARDAYREAVHCHESALAALTQMPQDSAARARGCDIRFELAEALYRQGALDRVMKTAREAHAQAEGLGDRPRVAYALGMLAHWHTNEGRYGEALEAGERSLALAESLGLTIVRIWTGIILGRACHALGRYARGIEYLRASLGAIGEDGDRRFAVRGVVPPSPQARTYLALCLSRTGDLDEALQVAEEAVRVGEALGGASDRAWAYYALGRVHHARTDWIRAVPLLERAVALCEADGVAAYFPRLLSGLGSAYAQSGRVAEALPLLERALEASRAMRFAYGQTLIIAQLGTTCVDAGRLDEAAEHAARALAIARERGERGEEAWALLLAGDAAAHRAEPDLDGARAWYEKALALGEELGMRPLAARCRLGLGELERRAGRPEAARAHFRRAADDADGMGIASWRTRARQELERL